MLSQFFSHNLLGNTRSLTSKTQKCSKFSRKFRSHHSLEVPRNQPHHNPSISPNKCSNRRQRGREAWQDRQKSFHMHRSPDLRMTQGGLSLLVLLPHLLLLSPDAKSKVRFHHNQECSIETFLKSPDKSKYKCRIGFYLLDFCSSQILSFIICPGPGKLPIS